MTDVRTTIIVNGSDITRSGPPHYSLLRWLRDLASVFDVKYGCGESVCGACAVLIDGKSVSSCVVLAVQADGRRITTLAGLAGADGPSALQEAFVEYGAAQCGFCTPGMLLAATEAVAGGELTGRDDIRSALHGNLCRCTGYQAVVDAVESVMARWSRRVASEEVRRSKAADLKVVNQPVRRRDAAEKVAGTTRFSGDIGPHGLVHARLVRSAFAHALLVSRNVSAAKAIDGVIAVLLGEDVPNNEVWVDVPGQETEIVALKASMQVLATERVRYQGEPIALIIAETEDVFAAAEQAIEIEYAELPGVFDVQAALADDAPLVHDSGNLLAEWNISRGDVESAFAAADVVVDGEYYSQAVDHAYLEPEAGSAFLDDEGVITLTVATQVVEHFRDVAKILGVPHSKVRILAPYVGGGFGGKEDMTVEPYLALAVHRTGRPVRMVWTRQESLVARAKRHPMVMRYRTAAMADGTVLGHDIDITADSGAHAFLSALVLLYAAVTAAGPYDLKHVRLRSRVVYTNNAPCSAFRGFGGMQVVFAYESQMTRIAQELSIDPGDIRKQNALRVGDRLPVGQPIETEVLLGDTIDAVRAAAGPLPMPSHADAAVRRGFASNIQPYGRLVWLHDTATAWIGFEHDGSLTVRIGVQDIGASQVLALAQIASEVLGLGMEDISVHFGDSARTPRAGTTTATRMLYMCGNAVHDGCVELRDHLLGIVARARGVPVERLAMVHGFVRSADLELPLSEVVALAVRAGEVIHVHHTFFGPTGPPAITDLAATRVLPDFTYGTHLADVEVDTRTGLVRVLRYVACHDVGRAINPVTVEGQIAGGAVQGIGQALLEEVVVRDGVNMTGGFFQYLIPTSSDVPDIETIVLESGEGLGPFGARGIGEPPIGPPAAAVANAIDDAIGVRLTRLPIRPESVWEALSAGELPL